MKACTVILAFEFVNQNRRYFAVFSRVKIEIFLIFRILVDLFRVERLWLWL